MQKGRMCFLSSYQEAICDATVTRERAKWGVLKEVEGTYKLSETASDGLKRNVG
jgi:hypothetical protein